MIPGEHALIDAAIRDVAAWVRGKATCPQDRAAWEAIARLLDRAADGCCEADRVLALRVIRVALLADERAEVLA
ncbi:hypothetical protein [Spirillospora sp. NBC_01491]|uniref:hypothetical protein n=1 Tax=Spirillospora sp. NBC_01491 TaxID=2976007 RepID=UPI002E3621A0|nr:hypothetical protein [Spirillospora sp. NBC_01491]